MYEYKHFKNCLFNPLEAELMVTAYPVLMEIVRMQWAEDEYCDKLIRYIIMVYDPRSPLVINERDMNIRKGRAADLAGMENEDPANLAAIYNCSFAYLPDLTIAFLQRFVKSKEWAAICAFESTYWESIKELLLPIEGKDSKQKLESVQKKSAIKSEIQLDIQRLEALYKSFCGMDDDLLVKARKKLTPEQIANGS